MNLNHIRNVRTFKTKIGGDFYLNGLTFLIWFINYLFSIMLIALPPPGAEN